MITVERNLINKQIITSPYDLKVGIEVDLVIQVKEKE